jgi:phage terminase large subunit
MPQPSTTTTHPTEKRKRQLVVARAFVAKYRNDPVRFAREVLGIRCWRLQAEILRLAAKSNRVSVKSGHKVGKSKAVAVLALWWVATRSEARVVLLAPSYRQISEIVWREIKETHRNARMPLGGEVFTNPEQGIRWRDGRQIFGFSTDSKERVAGFSGNILYVLDEASGIPDEVHEVVSTNPGGTVVMISNPTRSSGAFYDSHNQGAAENGGVWQTLTISSEAAAEANAPVEGHPGRYRFKYLANAEWIEARKREFGEGSPYYDIRVRGEFAKQADNAVIAAGLVDAAVKRWDSTDPDGPLRVGVDVARFGADDSGIVWRRGNWSSEPITVHGFDTVAVANVVRRVCADFKHPGERPVVRVDTSNGYGAGVADILRQDDDKDIVDVNASESATEKHYARMRDELWFRMSAWLKAGGAIALDKILVGELKAPTYKVDDKGRQKVESKDDLKKRLRRSPDRADALALAVYDDASGGEWASETWGER